MGAMAKGLTITQQTKLVIEECCNCHMLFAMTTEFKQEKLENRFKANQRTFYCPAGHPQMYTGKTAEQEAIERAEDAERWRANAEESLRAERAGHTITRRKLTRTSNQLKSTERRVANGVCPCCHRTFKQLARHMDGQHPKYVETKS